MVQITIHTFKHQKNNRAVLYKIKKKINLLINY